MDMARLPNQLLWLLVEWVDERNVFPSYGVVNVDAIIGNDTDLHPGKMVVIQGNQRSGAGARRAQILRISDEKNHVKEHKILLERQDHQVKNVLSLCMRTIKEMKSDPIYFGSMGASQPVSIASGSNSNMTQIVANNYPASSSDDDSEFDEGPKHNVKVKQPSTVQYAAQQKRGKAPSTSFGHGNQFIEHQTVRKSSLARRPVASTPVPTNGIKEPPKTMTTQGTQTDDVDRPQQEKLEQMEGVLNHLYRNFLSLVEKLKIFPLSSSELVETEALNGTRYEADDQRMGLEATNAEQVENEVTIEEDFGSKPNVRALQVRRMSAHTTNDVVEATMATESENVDMVAIGSGNATVPARLMNEINWGSYTSATRQLLQAIFPRKILATHSLTGKKSPAFTNRAPKKCLDPKLVNDIVDTVSQRCGVPKNLVRSSITTKCTDEAKLFRNRQQGRNSHQAANQENVPPSPLSSYESSSPKGELV